MGMRGNAQVTVSSEIVQVCFLLCGDGNVGMVASWSTRNRFGKASDPSWRAGQEWATRLCGQVWLSASCLRCVPCCAMDPAPRSTW